MTELYSRIADRVRWEMREWRAPSRPAFVHEELDRALLDGIQWRPGELALDVGCAHGQYLRALQERGVRTIGVDLDAAALRKASIAGCRAAAADALRLPFANESFDALVCHKTLHLLLDVEAAADEFNRVVRRGGRIVFSTSNRVSPYARVKIAATRNGRNRNWGRSNSLSAAEWCRAFGRRGFAVRAVYSCNLVWPVVYRVCDRWIVPNEWMRRYARWVRRVSGVPLRTDRPSGAAMDYVVEVVKTPMTNGLMAEQKR